METRIMACRRVRPAPAGAMEADVERRQTFSAADWLTEGVLRMIILPSCGRMARTAAVPVGARQNRRPLVLAGRRWPRRNTAGDHRCLLRFGWRTGAPRRRSLQPC